MALIIIRKKKEQEEQTIPTSKKIAYTIAAGIAVTKIFTSGDIKKELKF